MTIRRLFIITLFSVMASAQAADKYRAFEASPAWLAGIEKIAPAKPLAAPRQKRTALVFSLMTGYKHWCTPHTREVIRILGEKSGAFEVVISDDIKHFEAENIRAFDLIILNNNCSERAKRHLFFDVLKDMDQAQALEASLIKHIAAGHGLVGFHGAITIFNYSEDFSAVMGGSFERHPRQQTVIGHPVNPDHPILTAFKGKPLVHFDEPYFFNRAYTKYNFHPLLEMELPDGEKKKKAGPAPGAGDQNPKRFISWIKPHGKGRVFYCSPSHNAQSFEQPDLLQFILNGIQYAAGDLDCDDTPLQEPQP